MKKKENKFTRELNGMIRTVEGEGNENKVILSFSSETPYRRWFGPEILSHEEGAMNMERLKELGVVLFNHHTDEVVGKIAKVWIENERGMAEIEFDSDEKSQIIKNKVTSGTLKGVSVGYIVNLFEEVEANATSQDGKFEGPCSVARSWTPYEISIVSIPADPTVGVGRSAEDDESEDDETLEKQFKNYENIVAYNNNLCS